MIRIFNTAPWLVAAGLVCLIAGTSACSDDADEQRSGAPVATKDALYAVSARVLSPEDEVLYIALVPSLDKDDELDLTGAVEFPGGGLMFGKPESKQLFVASFSEPTIERWSLSEAGELERDRSVSFANLGLPNVAANQVFSQGKAYFLANGELVMWDPEEMALLDTFEIPELAYTGEGEYEPSVSVMALNDETLLLFGLWQGVEDWNRWADHSTQVVFDSKKNEVVRAFDEPRSEMLDPFGKRTAAGTIYFSSDPAYQTDAFTFGDEYGSRPIALRMHKGETGFDDQFELDMSALVEGRPAGILTPVSDDTFFLDVLHTELLGRSFDDPEWSEGAPPAYRYWIWHPGDDAAMDIVEQEPRAASTAFQAIIDNKVYVQDHDSEYANWQLIELRADGTLQRTLSGQGYSAGLLRVR
jgi:hypothetical protein